MAITLNGLTGITSPNIDSEVGNNTPAEGNFTVVNTPVMNVGGLAVSPQTGFKNRIINGGMVIDQRNAGAAFTSNGLFYSLDRWMLQAVGATNTVQQVAGTSGNIKAARITGNTSNTLTGYSQRIESWNIFDCASQSVTVSFILSGSTAGSVSIRRIYPTVTDNYTSTTEPDAGVTVNFTTTPTAYQATFTLSANADKGLWLYFDFGGVGAGVTRTLQAVQLEKGSTATPFEFRSYGQELALCQRYYFRIKAEAANRAFSVGGQAISSTTLLANTPYPVTMRVRPSALEQNGTAADYRCTNAASTAINCSAVPAFDGLTTQYVGTVSGTVASGLVAGDATTLFSTNANAYLGWSAEL